MYPEKFSTFSMYTSQSTNKMAANDGRPKLTIIPMFRRFSNMNTLNAIKIVDAGG